VPPAQLEREHFFALRVVDDRSSRPIPDVKVEVTLVDGATRLCTTDREGWVRLPAVEPGSHGVSCPLGGAMLARTLEFVSMGESPGPSKGGGAKKKAAGRTTRREAAADQRPVYSIACVKAHKVKKGDTLDRIAGAHQMTGRELAHFNWGVHADAEIEQRLRDEVGCLGRDEEGRCVLDDGDDPGIVYVPQKWSKQGLMSDREHTVRVRPVARALPDLRFLYQLDTHAPNVENDTLALETEDGSWSHELAVSGLSEVYPGWVELVFPEPPSGQTFNLIQDPKDGQDPFYVFHGIGYGELLEAQQEQAAQDAADEAAESSESGDSGNPGESGEAGQSGEGGESGQPGEPGESSEPDDDGDAGGSGERTMLA
jgi:hypothetical protein